MPLALALLLVMVMAATLVRAGTTAPTNCAAAGSNCTACQPSAQACAFCVDAGGAGLCQDILVPCPAGRVRADRFCVPTSSTPELVVIDDLRRGYSFNVFITIVATLGAILVAAVFLFWRWTKKRDADDLSTI